MESRRIYVSFAPQDAEHLRRLFAMLEAVGLKIVTTQPDLIAGADLFLACFAAASLDAPASYNQAEVQRAIVQLSDVPPDVQWLVLAKLKPCTIPALPGIPADVAVLDLHERWTESIGRLITTTSAPGTIPGKASFKATMGEVSLGQGSMINVRNDGGGNTPYAQMEIETKSLVVEGSFDFVNVTRT